MHVMITLDRPSAAVKDGRALFDKVAASLRRQVPRREADAETLAALRSLRFEEALLGEFFEKQVLAGRVIGRARRSMRAAKVREKDGYTYEFDAEGFDPDDQPFQMSIKGEMVVGTSYVQEQLEEKQSLKSGKSRACTASMTLEGEKCRVKLEVNGTKLEYSYDVSAPSIPWHMAEATLGHLAKSGLKTASFYTLYPLFDHPQPIQVEFAAAETMKLDDGTRSMRVAFIKGRYNLIFEENGALWSTRWSDGRESRRCTKADYLKAKE